MENKAVDLYLACEKIELFGPKQAGGKIRLWTLKQAGRKQALDLQHAGGKQSSGPSAR
jgi:hypothetical protein